MYTPPCISLCLFMRNNPLSMLLPMLLIIQLIALLCYTLLHTVSTVTPPAHLNRLFLPLGHRCRGSWRKGPSGCGFPFQPDSTWTWRPDEVILVWWLDWRSAAIRPFLPRVWHLCPKENKVQNTVYDEKSLRFICCHVMWFSSRQTWSSSDWTPEIVWQQK